MRLLLGVFICALDVLGCGLLGVLFGLCMGLFVGLLLLWNMALIGWRVMEFCGEWLICLWGCFLGERDWIELRECCW
jgi:hypothetical protein